jgi:hypothetical protein
MIGNIISFILGANISLFLYACILVGKDADEKIKDEGGKN